MSDRSARWGVGRRRRRREAVDLGRLELVRSGEVSPGWRLPLLLEPAIEGVDLAEWAAAERDSLEHRLLTHGGLLFRGFGVDSEESFERVARVFCRELYDGYGDLPRDEMGRKIYSSTPYPPERAILFHNESSQMHRWPLRQMFCCLRAASTGGETPIADSREVYRRLPRALRDLFEEKGVLYVRNFVDGLDVPWPEFFRTDDRSQVEGYCAAAGLECEWRPGGQLRTRRRSPAVAIHPETGEKVFFNQIQAHHISCLEEEEQRSLLSLFGEESLPRNVYFGDGSRIDASMMRDVIGVYRELAVQFPWQKGDVLLLDNMLTAHSRNPYEGERKIVVAMGRMVEADQVARAPAAAEQRIG